MELNEFNNQVVGERLRQRRLELGLTQTKVANAINVTLIALATFVCVSPNSKRLCFMRVPTT